MTTVEIEAPQHEALLMRSFYEGSEEAFAELASRLRTPLRGYLCGQGFAQEDAEDLTQEVLVKLYLTRERRLFDLAAAVRPFVFTMARNLAIEEWRKSTRRCRTELLEHLPEVPSAGRSEVSLLEEALMECVRKLPENLRTYILLCGKHGLGDLSHNDIAEILKKWPAQVTSLSKRAKQQLAACMAGRGFTGAGEVRECRR